MEVNARRQLAGFRGHQRPLVLDLVDEALRNLVDRRRDLGQFVGLRLQEQLGITSKPAGGVEDIVEECSLQRQSPLFVADVLQRTDGKELTVILERHRRDLEIDGIEGVADRHPALPGIRPALLGGEDRLHRTTGLTGLGRATTSRRFRCMEATQGLTGSTPEHVGRRFDAQEAEGRAIGEDDLPVFVEEQQDVRNRTQDLIQQRDTRKQLEQVDDFQLRRPLGGCKLGLHDFHVLLRPRP